MNPLDDKHLISNKSSIRGALEKLDQIGGKGEQTLFVIDEDRRLEGALTDGDIRRGLLNGSQLEDGVTTIMNSHSMFLTQGAHTLQQVHLAQKKFIEILPMVDANRQIVKLFNLSNLRSVLPIDAVIMAGGKGVRLRPLTDNTPKPLLKVGDKPIIEYNIDLLGRYGIQNITITLKYLGQQIVDTYGNGHDRGLQIDYIWEDEPLGTIGAISLVESFTHDTILVMNSDLLTNINVEELYEKFVETDASMTVATVPYKVSVPYGILEYEGDRVSSLREKPTYIYQANAGIYLIKKSALALIPRSQHFNATDLMSALIQQGKTVSYFPILGYWLDIGKHEDFQKAQSDVAQLSF